MEGTENQDMIVETVVSKGENKDELVEEEMVNGEEVKKDQDAKEEVSNGEDANEEVNDDEDAKEDVNNEEESGEKSKEKPNKSKKRIRKKKGPKNTAKDGDEPKSSEKKITKKAEGMGMIFMCSSKTKKDCYRCKVLGLPASKKDLVSKIYRGMRLFLFDVDLKLLYGIYKAAGPGGYNLEPKAFKGAFPAQVRFTVLDDCLPLAEEKFKKIIKDNYYNKNKFDCQLTSEQVKNLCKLFVRSSKGGGGSASKGPKSSKPLVRSRRPEAPRSSYPDRERIRRPHREEDRRPAYREEDRRAGDYHYPDTQVSAYERGREILVAPVSHHHALPPPTLLPSYGYRRTLEPDVYRRDQLDRDPLDLEFTYRRRDEIGFRDPYIPPREALLERPLLYRDPYSSVGTARAEYYSLGGQTAEYRRPSLEHRVPVSQVPPEYHHPVRSLYPY